MTFDTLYPNVHGFAAYEYLKHPEIWFPVMRRSFRNITLLPKIIKIVLSNAQW